jgi:hypothetical protein
MKRILLFVVASASAGRKDINFQGDNMRLRRLTLLVLVAGLLFVGAARVSAAEKFGVPVYPGAKLDTAVTKFLKQTSHEAAGYRTSDSITKVVNFYRKQAGMELIDSNAEAALFRRDDVDVTVQSPWMDRKTVKMMKDTLIAIRRHKK